MYTPLSTIKKHICVDEEYTADDEYILHLCAVSESAVAKRLNLKSLGELMTDEGYLPEDVTHAVLLMIGNFYASRESYSNLSVNKIPYNLDFLFDLNRNFNEPF